MIGTGLRITTRRAVVASGGGDGLPPAPDGFAYVVDGSGNYIVDADGAYLIVAVA